MSNLIEMWRVEFNRNVACSFDVLLRIDVRQSWRDWEALFRTIVVIIRKPAKVHRSLSEWWYLRNVFALEVFRDEIQSVEAYTVTLAVTELWRLMLRLMCRRVNYRQAFLHCSNVHVKAIAKRSVFKHNQQDATLHNDIYYYKWSTCFRRFLRPSSGAQNCVHSIGYLSSFYCFWVSWDWFAFAIMMGGGTAWNL
jgi:hypothetical protein